MRHPWSVLTPDQDHTFWRAEALRRAQQISKEYGDEALRELLQADRAQEQSGEGLRLAPPKVEALP